MTDRVSIIQRRFQCGFASSFLKAKMSSDLGKCKASLATMEKPYGSISINNWWTVPKLRPHEFPHEFNLSSFKSFWVVMSKKSENFSESHKEGNFSISSFRSVPAARSRKTEKSCDVLRSDFSRVWKYRMAKLMLSVPGSNHISTVCDDLYVCHHRYLMVLLDWRVLIDANLINPDICDWSLWWTIMVEEVWAELLKEVV